MNKEQVKAAILKVAGNPEIGIIKEMADSMAEAIMQIDQPEVKKFSPVQETRIVEPPQTR